MLFQNSPKKHIKSNFWTARTMSSVYCCVFCLCLFYRNSQGAGQGRGGEEGKGKNLLKANVREFDVSI